MWMPIDPRCGTPAENPCFFIEVIVKSRSINMMTTTNEVVSSAGVKEQGVRLFFRPFLIMHLAPNTDMDGYLGFNPPKPHALL